MLPPLRLAAVFPRLRPSRITRRTSWPVGILVAALTPLAGLQAQSNYATPYTFSTLAGKTQNIGAIDGVGSAARFYGPGGVAVDGDGNVYVADIGNQTVRKITPGGQVTTLAGSAGSAGSTDGAGNVARFSTPAGVAVDSSGNVYVADAFNHTIRKITSAGVVSTLAGTLGNYGAADGTGSAAQFYYPYGVAVDRIGNVYVADTQNCTIRKITPTGVVTTLAGSAGTSGLIDGKGSAARLNGPHGVAVDSAGNVYVGDTGSCLIRKITPAGVVTTLAGSVSGAGSTDSTGGAARFWDPRGVAVDASGNVYVADFGNFTIRKITPTGVVTTLAGTAGSEGSSNGTGSTAGFSYPVGVAVDGNGNVIVGDNGNSTIRVGVPPQVVDHVTISKQTLLVQTSAADPVVNPRTPGPGYGGAYGFSATVQGTNLSGISSPIMSLAAGSQYPTEKPFVHNGGVFVNPGATQWKYGNQGGYPGTTTEAARDTSFAAGTYGLTVLGASFNLNFSTTSYPANAPVVTLSGGNWVAGKYVIDANQALTITSNAFVNFNQNTDGTMQLQFEGMVDQAISYSDNPAANNFIITTIPAGSLVPGRDYHGAVSFFAVMDQATVPALGASLNTARYEMRTQFTISTTTTTQLGARATFYALGDMDGGISFSDVRDVTKVGGVLYAVGGATVYNGSPGLDTAFLWTSTNGMTPLPSLVTDLTQSASPISAFASAITPDAAYIAGRSSFNVALHIRHAVRVTISGLTNLDLGTLPTSSHLGLCGATSISSDGSVMAGLSVNADGAVQAVRFTASGPTITAIPFLNAGDDQSSPALHGTSADGTVIVGTSSSISVSGNNPSAPGNVAFRYVEGSGVSAIPFLAGGSWNGAIALAPTGNLALVFGDSPGFESGQPYLHNVLNSSTTPLGIPAGYSTVTGGGMNADGSLVTVNFLSPSNVCFVRNSTGWHSLQDIVARAGVTLTDWALEDAFGMSADGTLIWGRGIHNGNYEGWIIEFAPGYLSGYGLTSDFDGDGKSDILLTNTATGDRAVWLMNGMAIGAGASLPAQATSWVFSGIGDFDGDGKSDIVLSNTVTGDRAIWLMDGTSIKAGVHLGVLSTDWSISGIGDFDGDGKADILLTNTVTGDRALWLMNGASIKASVYLPAQATSWVFSGIGDFDGDGKSDILLTNTATGDRAIWLMNGTTIATGAYLGVLDTNWSISGIGDFNGDCKSDVLLTNTATGDRAIWLMNGATISADAYLPAQSTDWVFSRVGDFDGDGKSDIFLTNTLTGDRAVWLMNGTSISAGAYLGVLSSDWHIAP